MSNFAKIHWKIKDTHREKAPINKIPALTKCTSMGVWVVGTSKCTSMGVWVVGTSKCTSMGVWVVGTSNCTSMGVL